MGSSLLIDFGYDSDSDWTVVNDGVMGGLSRGTVAYENDFLVFEGVLSLENNGGFSSIRSPQRRYDLSSFKKVSIRHRGGGGTYGLRLKTQEPYYMPYYKAEFTPSKEWTTSTFVLEEIPQWQLSRKTGNKISKTDLEQIIRLGIIKSDKKPGPFYLEVDFIEFH